MPFQIAVTDPQPSPGGRQPARPLFAIGDAHGHADALAALLAHLEREIAARHAGGEVDVVILGDLVDRGPDPLGCLRLAAAGIDRGGVRTRTLLGNHDWYLAAAAGLRGLRLSDRDRKGWLSWGGQETVAALGLDPWRAEPADYAAALGPSLCAFIEDMTLSFRTGAVLCVHAGVDPDRSHGAQEPRDLIWMREPFLSRGADPADPWPIRHTVAHGHTPDAWGVHAHRVGVDSGGFHYGVFMAAEFDGETVRLHSVARE